MGAGQPPANAAAAADELKQRVEALEKNLHTEELARNYVQLERVRDGRKGAAAVSRGRGGEQRTPTWFPLLRHSQDKIQAFWDIARADLGDRKAELLVKDRDLEEAQVRGGGASKRWRRGP